jgi:micrococcal nuclease
MKRTESGLKWWFLIPVTAIALAAMLIHAQAGTAQWVHARWVNDGDTIVLNDGRKVRYLGINTPEIDYERHREQPYAYMAKRFNHKLVGRKKIYIEFEQKKTDRYGRLLAYVFLVDGTFVNRQLLAKGYGYCYPSPQSGKYDAILLKTQREAMSVQAGIWRQWREPGKGAGYLGNKRSKRFHLVGCPNGKQISRKNRHHFKTMWDAFFAGYAPAKECINDQLGWRVP